MQPRHRGEDREAREGEVGRLINFPNCKLELTARAVLRGGTSFAYQSHSKTSSSGHPLQRLQHSIRAAKYPEAFGQREVAILKSRKLVSRQIVCRAGLQFAVAVG